MAVNKSKLPKPKAVSEVVITKDAFLALIRKYKNTSIAAGALVLALTSFMGISAFRVYSTHHTQLPEVKSAQSVGSPNGQIVSEAVLQAQPPVTTQGAVSSPDAPATSNQNASATQALSNAFASPTLPPKASSSQFDTSSNCTFTNGVPGSGKVCKIHQSAL